MTASRHGRQPDPMTGWPYWLLLGVAVLVLVLAAALVAEEATAKPKPPKPTKPPKSTTTLVATTTTVAPTTTTVAPTTTTEPEPTTTTTAGQVFTGTIELPADGDFPTIWGGFGTAPRCPDGTALDFGASTVTAPADVIVHYFPELLDSITLEMPIDPIIPEPIGGSPWRTRVISYRVVCV